MQLDEVLTLVVCQKSKVIDWIEHFKSNYPDVVVYDLTKSNDFDVFVYTPNNWDELDELYEGEDHANNFVGIINYDLVWRRPKLLKLTNFTLVLDESSLIQNTDTKRTEFILKLQPKNVILLSGTPCSGKYENLWSQMHLLGWNISEDLFKKQYTEVEYIDTDTRTIPVVVGYKNVERLKRKMADHGCQFLKTEEVFDLPEQVFTKTYVEPSDLYKKFRQKRFLEFQWCDEEVELVGDTTLTKMLYERELCGMYSEAKLDAFNDLISTCDDRFIVFYNFNLELEQLLIIAEDNDRPVSIVNGKTKDLRAYEDTDNSITFVQYQSGSKGLNLQNANRIIFFTPTLSCEDWMQSAKRIHRIGQAKTCFYYQMIVKNSVEEKIYQALEMGVNYTNDLFEKDDENDRSTISKES